MDKPNGTRRKLPLDLRSLARSHTVAAVETLSGVMRDAKQPAAARVSAAGILLDRGWGKPDQSHELNADIQITIRQILDVAPLPSSDNQKPLIDVTPNDKAKRSRT